MSGIIGIIVLVTFLIAGAIAGRRDGSGQPPSAGRFILRFIIAWVVVTMIAALLLFGACVVILGGLAGSGCINC
jgi:hypothetical protein